jgi:hypothetical protein
LHAFAPLVLNALCISSIWWGVKAMKLLVIQIFHPHNVSWPPLWSRGQSSWLQIRRPGFDSQHYQKKIVGLERDPLSLVSTTEELLDRKVAAPV